MHLSHREMDGMEKKPRNDLISIKRSTPHAPHGSNERIESRLIAGIIDQH